MGVPVGKELVNFWVSYIHVSFDFFKKNKKTASNNPKEMLLFIYRREVIRVCALGWGSRRRRSNRARASRGKAGMRGIKKDHLGDITK